MPKGVCLCRADRPPFQPRARRRTEAVRSRDSVSTGASPTRTPGDGRVATTYDRCSMNGSPKEVFERDGFVVFECGVSTAVLDGAVADLEGDFMPAAER